jgi:hypothetical protein
MNCASARTDPKADSPSRRTTDVSQLPPGSAASRFFPGLLAFVLLAGVVEVALDATRQRARHRQIEPAIRAVVRLLGTADMALSSASRWLRHPSLSEPGAAFADSPAILDADPAGAMIAPPHAVLAGSLKEPIIRLRRRAAR